MKLKKLLHNPYFMIIATYTLAHFFLLLLNGCWWDDWTFMTHNTEYIAIVARDSGRPEWNLLIPLCWSLPNNGRILIYFMYLGISLFVYRLLKESTLFSDEDSLVIALLFSTVPVNEARLLISNFPYTVGLFLFYLGFMLFVSWNKIAGGMKKTVIRILILGLFYLSFILTSLLAYYYIVIAYLFVLELRKATETNWFRKSLKAALTVVGRYFDFFVLPFVHFGLQKVLFPVSDLFAGRSSVSAEGLIRGLFCVPLSMIKVFADAGKQFIWCLDPLTAAILAGVLVVIYLTRPELEKHSWIDALKYLLYGLPILLLALFPYAVIRMNPIETIGVKGRDAILVPLGIALLSYALMLPIKGKCRSLLIGSVLLLSIFSCNGLYLEWQRDYYEQLVLEDKLDDPVIAANDTFFLIDLGESKIEGQRYYSLNTNAYHVYGDMTRLFIPKVSNLNLLMNEEDLDQARELFDHAYLMEDYDPEDLCFDAILDYSCDFSDGEVWKLKYLELTNQERFGEELGKHGSLDIYIVDDDFTALLLKAYADHALHGDDDVRKLLDAYMK